MGGTSAVGASIIKKLAKLFNIHPIIAVADAGAPFVESLIDRSKGDTIVDYRNGDQAVITGIREAVTQAGCDKVEYAFDATTASNSWSNIAGALTPSASITLYFSTGKEKGSRTLGAKEFGHAWYRLLGLGLREGWMTPIPSRLSKGGLKSVGKVLEDVKAGKASAVKYVLRISETEGILSDKLQSEPAFIT